MSTIALLSGGTSDERAVSLRSGQAVANGLRAAGHSLQLVDPVEPLENYLKVLLNCDVVFPVMHGAGGEDGAVQKFCELHDLPYVGADSGASQLCFDKYTYAELLAARAILVPPTELVTVAEFNDSQLARNPYVLKPNDGGSSIDTFIVRDISEAKLVEIKSAFQRHKKLLLQELIVGTEITVPVLLNEPLPVIEIIPPLEQEFDYENKYNGATQELCPPQNVSDGLQTQAQELALRIHNLTGCTGMSRTDMIIRDGQLYVLETNTIPGLTNQSLFPKAAAVSGITMVELCDQLVKDALNRA